MTREQMIKAMCDSLANWDHDSLLNWAQGQLEEELNMLSDGGLQLEYDLFFGDSDQ